MAILNYTTTVDAFKTVSEIEYILVKHKAPEKGERGLSMVSSRLSKRR